MPAVDVVVIGLGGMGSAALANLALRGASAIGIEQFTRGHLLGSSSGKSRMIRKAYFEHANYIPLLLRAYDAWDALEQRTGIPIFRKTSVLLAGPEDSRIDSRLSEQRESARPSGRYVERVRYSNAFPDAPSARR